MNRVHIRRLATSLLAIATALPGAALAQTGSGNDVSLDEIVVTARKVEENLQAVPVAVTAFTGEALETQNATRLGDVARLTPSLSVKESSSNPTGLALTLRGQVQTAILSTLDPSVGTYVDGYNWARAYGLNTDLLDVQSIQVLKGPQGTLFGRNTTGGAILFQTNDPSFTGFSGRISGTYGRFDEANSTIVLNAPLLEDKLAFRIAAQKTTRDGTVRDLTTGAKHDERDSWSGRAKLLFTPTSTFSLLLSAEHYESDAAAPARQMIYAFPGGAVFAAAGNAAAVNSYIALVQNNRSVQAVNVTPQTFAKTDTYTGTATLDTDAGTLKFIGGYRKIKTGSRYDLDGSPFQVGNTSSTAEISQYSGELQFAGDLIDGDVDYVIGAMYFEESGTDGSVSQSTPLSNPRDTVTAGEIDNTSLGAYGQATWHVTDKLSLTGGLRYSSDEKGLAIRNKLINRQTGVLTCAISTALAPECLLQRSDTFSGWSYLAGADYQFTPDVMAYLKSSKGFRSGGQNLRAPSAAAFLPFNPEVAYEQELGLKSEFLDRRLRVNVAAFYDILEDIQRNNVIATPTGSATIIGNAGKASFWGVELETTAVPIAGLQLSATASLTKPKYIEYRDLSGDRRHERFEGVSEASFSLAATYTRDLSFASLMLHADYAWLDEAPLAPNNNPNDPLNNAIIAASTKPAAGIVNARISLDFENNLEVAVFGRNLGDNRDLSNATLLPSPLGYISGQFREPMTYGVTATYRFGAW